MDSIALVGAIGRHRGRTGRHEGAGTGLRVRNTLTISVELSSYLYNLGSHFRSFAVDRSCFYCLMTCMSDMSLSMLI